MKATDTKATQRDKRKAGLSALLRDNEEEVEEIVNDAPALKEKHKSPMTLGEIMEAEQKPKEVSAEVRVTLLMNRETHEKIKIMAHWELTSLKDIINTSLEATIVEYERTHGQLANVPKSQRKK
jgi:hypothetical protein